MKGFTPEITQWNQYYGLGGNVHERWISHYTMDNGVRIHYEFANEKPDKDFRLMRKQVAYAVTFQEDHHNYDRCIHQIPLLSEKNTVTNRPAYFSLIS